MSNEPMILINVRLFSFAVRNFEVLSLVLTVHLNGIHILQTFSHFSQETFCMVYNDNDGKGSCI